MLYEQAVETICYAIGIDGVPKLIKKEWRNLMENDGEANYEPTGTTD